MKPSPLTTVTVFLGALFLVESSLRAQHPPTSSEHALNVGDKAPAFSLSSQDGEKISLEALVEKGPVALVFYRSADW